MFGENLFVISIQTVSSGYTKYSIDEYKPPGIPLAEEVQTGSVKLSFIWKLYKTVIKELHLS